MELFGLASYKLTSDEIDKIGEANSIPMGIVLDNHDVDIDTVYNSGTSAIVWVYANDDGTAKLDNEEHYGLDCEYWETARKPIKNLDGSYQNYCPWCGQLYHYGEKRCSYCNGRLENG